MRLHAAISGRDADALPGRRDEDWRWTDLRGLIRVVPPASPAGQASGEGPWAAIADEEIAVVNGRAPTDAITIAAGQPRAVRLRFVSTAEAGAHAARLRIALEAEAELTLLESYEGDAAASYLALAEIDIDVGPGARLTRLIIADDGADGVSVSQATVTLAPNARLHQLAMTTGARRQRIETRVAHPGQGAEVRMDGLYRLSAKRHADQTTVVQHQGPGGVTSQLTKGVAADQSRGVFQGRIVVERGADGTDARMGHHALLLSDKAEVDAKPELEIYADDVACAHGNTVGALSDEALFYARSRGIPEAEARAMLTTAFLAEVVERVEPVAARDAAHAWLASTLEGGV